jgi:chitinase
MVFGIPSFGFEFQGATGPGTDFTKGSTKQIPYKDIVANTAWKFHFDSVSVEPYGTTDNSYVTFEDPHSAAVKSRWVKENGYAGIMVWEVSHDYIEGVGNPILDSIAVVLREGTTGIHEFHKKRAASWQDALRMPNAQTKHVNALGKRIQNADREHRWKNRFEFRVEP